ncbi:DUF523 domain-containing protein [Burkholderia sp. AU28942]|uniref:DUF523 domain-containing protein n=1 Tax=Burkholderia TaxID=32008 RepID=UPI000841BBAC|nr:MULTISPECIES: DUF523 domain-containing protein [Burkholderia]AOK08349.1 hypothetical protein WK25_28575 [Burkholderia latens]MCA8308429.1 DUF523 domain-containing protein [Burkholderia sp. AU28942]
MQNAARQSALAKILVSMCVLGHPVRYNGSAKTAAHDALARWQREGRLVPVCPELAGGLSVPRPPAEIADGATGQRVLTGAARIVDVHGADVTAQFVDGAQAALALARAHDCRFAILADGSPSCGSRFIHDGSFTGRRHAGAGVTAALLRQHGVEVFADTEFDALAARVAQYSQAE